MMRKTRTAALGLICCLFAGLAVPDPGRAAEPGLRAQLAELAAAHGFAVQGLDKVGQESGKTVTGKLEQRLRLLLDGYDYIVLHDAKGAIQTVRISNRQSPATASVNRFTVRTRRLGNHHLVEAEMVGRPASWQTMSLMVDTGASTVVLPESMITRLGFRLSDLDDGWSQTANGRVRTKTGALDSLRVGNAIARDVRVTFIADSRLAGKALLGMSFLDRFKVTLDDQRSEMVLVVK